MTDRNPTLALTPHGHVILVEREEASSLADAVAARLRDGFARGSAAGLLAVSARPKSPTAAARAREPAAAATRTLVPRSPATAAPGMPLAIRVLQLLRKRGALTPAEAGQALDEAEGTLRPLLDRLIASGLAAKIGRGPAARYHALD